MARHEFFKGFDWAKLVARELVPPYIPDVEDDEDISNFEEPDEEAACEGDVVIKPEDYARW